MAQENENNNKPKRLYELPNREFLDQISEIIAGALEHSFIPDVGARGDFKSMRENMRADVSKFVDDMSKDTRNLAAYGAALDALKNGKFAVITVRDKNAYGRTFESTVGLRLTGNMDNLRAVLIPVDRSMPISEHPFYKELNTEEQASLMKYGIVGTPGNEPGTIGNVYQYDSSMNTIFKASGEAIFDALDRSRGKFFGQQLTSTQQAAVGHLGAIATNREHTEFAIFSARDEGLVRVTNQALLTDLREGREVNLVPRGAFVAKQAPEARQESRRGTRAAQQPKPEAAKSESKGETRGRAR